MMTHDLPAGLAAVLERGETIDITTLGRHTGQPRRIELVYHNVDGRILLSGHPGFPRSWIANLRAHPRFTFHLKRSVHADLPATARVITDMAERERFLGPIAASWHTNLPVMVRSSPLVEVTFD